MENLKNFGRFAEGQERKKLISKNREETENFKENGAEKIRLENYYTWIDSPLDIDNDDGYHGVSYRDTFKRVLPIDGNNSSQEFGLREYIEKILEKRKGEAIGVEFGGIGVNLFEGFSSGFFKKSIGMTLVDHRNVRGPGTPMNLSDKKEGSTHKVLEGDIFSSDSYKLLGKELNGNKIDLIIERMANGLEFVPEEPYMVSKTLQTWYKLLNENGIMLVQVPSFLNELLKKWARVLRKEYMGMIDFDFKIGEGNTFNSSVFRLHKLANAPDELPLLDPRTVKNTRKNDVSPLYHKI